MTNKNIALNENVPQNSIGVCSTTDDKSALTPEKIIPIISNNDKYENANHAVDELIKLKGIRITGKRRIILEFISKCVLKRHYPTSKEISGSLNIKKEALKKFLNRLCKLGLVVLYPINEGRYQRYSLYNMQDFKLNFENEYYNSNRNNPPHKDKDNSVTVIENILLQMTAINGLMDAERVMFHHISLSTEFDSQEHYKSLNWKRYSRNEGKYVEYRLARHHSCLVTAYPPKKLTLVIRCSKDPYDLLSDEGYTNFVGDCGEILRLVKDELEIPQVLQDNISDWKVMQIDCAIDIKTGAIDSLINVQQKNIRVTFTWPGTVRVKHLNQIFQIYLKRLPIKGVCLRLEKRLSFNRNPPNLSWIINHYKNSSNRS